MLTAETGGSCIGDSRPDWRCKGDFGESERGAYGATGRGFTVWFTGISGVGKTTTSRVLAQRLRERGARVEVLDGDEIRKCLSRGLGYSREERDENIRRIGFICEILCRNDIVVIVAAISPYRSARDAVRAKIRQFIEIYMECPLEILIKHDSKGLYKKALAGEIQNLSGISDPYEPPLNPDVVIHSYRDTVEDGVVKVCEKLENLGLASQGAMVTR